MSVQAGDRDEDREAAALAAASAGDQHAFQQLIEPYRRELHVHCYRLLGSVHDAEDAVQETWLRAWRHLATYEGRGSFRAWLYRIATNVCLTQRARARAAPPSLPGFLVAAATSSDEPASRLSPYPDAWLDELPAATGNPAAEYDLHEGVQLAFLAAVQLLPPRQRAVLILRDVAGWSAREVAELLDSTTASVNSALQRARTALEQQRQAGRLHADRAVPASEHERSVVRRYVEAWQAVDIGRLAGLLKHDVIMTMPPLPLRYIGREAVVQFLTTVPAAEERDRYRFIPTRANRRSALAVYRLDPHGDAPTYRAWGMFVFGVEDASVAEITAFVDPTLLPVFGLPAEIGVAS